MVTYHLITTLLKLKRLKPCGPPPPNPTIWSSENIYITMVRINKEENDGKPIDNHYKLMDVFPIDSLKTNCPLPPQEYRVFFSVEMTIRI